MSKPLPGQAEACEEFRAGLALLDIGPSRFANLTKIRYDAVKNWVQGDSKPTDAALMILRLMVECEVSEAEATDIMAADGLDLRAAAREALGDADYERLVLNQPPRSSPGRS